MEGVLTMELMFKQLMLNLSEEPCEENTPKEDRDENNDIPEYDYNKRLWF